MSDEDDWRPSPWTAPDGDGATYLAPIPGLPTAVHEGALNALEASINENLKLLSDVFGINRQLPRNYTPRRGVDYRLFEAIQRGMHVVIHGSSKQGKTCLRLKFFEGTPAITLTCSPDWSLADLHAQILRASGYVIMTQHVESTTESAKRGVKIEIGLQKVVDTKAGLDRSREASSQRQATFRQIELDLTDANAVGNALASIKPSTTVVLDDFHYLSEKTQRDFSLALKAYHDSGAAQFVVIGVWLDRNRLVALNGDLNGRIASINADVWTDNELFEVVSAGASMLNATFDAVFIREVVAQSRGSVWIVQELCYRACQQAGIVGGTDVKPHPVGVGFDIDVNIADLILSLNARFKGLLRVLAKGDEWPDSNVFKWIVGALLASTVEELQTGIHVATLQAFLEEHDARAPASMDLRMVLMSLTLLQADNHVVPVVLDYNNSDEMLTIVDRSFLLWLDLVRDQVADLLAEADLPGPFIRSVAAMRNAPGRHRK